MDPNFWLALAAAILGGASIVLHVVAPRTKTTIDDRLVARLDELLGLLRPPAPTIVPGSSVGVAKFGGPVGVLALVVLGLAAASSSACTPEQRTATAHAVIDCTAASGVAIGALATSMRGDCAAGPGTDWGCVRSKAISAGLQVGGCAFLELVTPATARVASATGEPPPERPGVAAFESYRASVAGGAAFRTRDGDR